MSDRALIHYQPITGPVWREPVAAALAWLPRGEPSRPLERRSLGTVVYPPFYELYNPNGLHWLPSGRWPIYPEIRKLGDFQQPPFQALYKPEQLGWLPSLYYTGRVQRGLDTYTVFPVQVTTPAFDPQDLEWIPKDSYLGRTLSRSLYDLSVYPLQPPQGYDPQNLEWLPRGLYPQVLIERRAVGDFQQPIFTSLYDPNKLDWVLQGQYPGRALPFVWTGSYVVDPIPRPNAAPPNLHKIYYDISSGRLFIQVSVTANPTLIEPL